MPQAYAGPYTVTPELLADLAHRVLDVQAYLDETPDFADEIEGALGSDAVASALHHFVSGWHDGRKQISTEVGELSAMLTQAAGVYADTDSCLAGAIPGSGS